MTCGVESGFFFFVLLPRGSTAVRQAVIPSLFVKPLRDPFFHLPGISSRASTSNFCLLRQLIHPVPAVALFQACLICASQSDAPHSKAQNFYSALRPKRPSLNMQECAIISDFLMLLSIAHIQKSPPSTFHKSPISLATLPHGLASGLLVIGSNS